MTVNIVVAYCKGNGIGKNNTLPWCIPQDLKHFSKLTKGNNTNMVVMGRKTWESLPNKPLPNRFNAIVTTTLSIDINGVKTFKSFKDVLDFSRKKHFSNVWIIGGQQLYKTALDEGIVDEIHVSIIDEEYDCDTFFPYFSEIEYKKTLEKYISEKVTYTIFRKNSII